MPANPLGRKGDRGERILDLVGDALRHLAPGGRLLRVQQVAHVLDHEDVTHVLLATTQAGRGMLQRGNRDGEVAAPPADLHLEGTSGGADAHRPLQEVFQRPQIAAGEQVREARGGAHALGAEQPLHR